MRAVRAFAANASLAFLLGSASMATAQVPLQPRYQNFGTACMEQLPDPSNPANSTATNPTNCFSSLPAAGSCPISLRAQHRADGTILKVDKARPAGLAQKLHLTLSNKGPRQIVAALLRVSGSSGKGKLSQTNTAQGGMNLTLNSTPSGMDFTRNVTVRLQPTADNESTGDAWVAGMSAVLQVELSTVTYDDGSVQRFTAGDGCRFRPDHLMLIADR